MKSTSRRSSALMLATIIAFSMLSSNLAQARHIGSSTFRVIFNVTMRDENKDKGIALEEGIVEPVGDIQYVESEAEFGAWRFVVAGKVRTGPGFYRVLRGTGQIENFGSYARYLFLMPYAPAGKNLLPHIREDGDMRRYSKYWAEGRDEVKGELSFDEGQVSIAAIYEYGNDDDNQVRDRLRDFFDTSRDVMSEYYNAVDDAVEKRYKELEKTPVTYLDNADLMVVLDAELLEFAEENEQASLGYFSWVRSQKMDMELFNNGDEIIFAQWFAMGSREQVQKLVLEDAVAYLTKNHLKDGRMQSIRDPESATTLSIRLVFPLADGAYEGRQIRKAYDEWKNDYGEKLYDEMNKLIDDTTAGLWDSIKDEKPTYMPEAELHDVITAIDLREFAGESDAKEGFFEFVLEEVSLEATNSGTELMAAIWWNLPDGISDDQKMRIVEKANKEVSGKKIKHFGPAKVSMYPGYDQVLRAAVTIPIDGSVTNRQIREGFNDLTEKMCHEIDKKVRKVIDKET